MTKTRFFLGFGFGALLAALSVIAAIVLAAGVVNPFLRESGWVSWLRAEKHKMLQSAPGRLVVVAGSSAAFGVAASDLERRTGMRTVNAASHVNVVYRLLDQAPLGLLSKGDIVLMPLENTTYSQRDELNLLSIDVGHQEGSAFFRSLPARLQLEYLRSLSPGFIATQLKRRWFPEKGLPTYGYWMFGLTPHGDLDLTEAKPAPEVVRARAAGITRAARGINRNLAPILCESVRRLADRGIRVIGTPDNIHLSNDRSIEDRAALLTRAAALFQRCGGEWLPVKDNGLQPLDRMLDTEFHPNLQGRALRTRELADALCARIVSCPQEKNAD